MSGLGGVLLFLGAAVVVWWMFGRGNTSSDDLREALEGGVRVLDVRTPPEFAGGHAKGAVNIPVGELGVRLGELGEPGPIVVYCASGMRSARAASLLRAAGFEPIDAKRLGALPPEWIEG